MKNYIIREMEVKEYPILRDFLYEAIFQRDENNLLPRDVVDQTELKVFIEDFGKKDDCCLVAELDGNIVGAVWTRILGGDNPGFGHIDDETPEFALSILKQYRGMGIGGALMDAMLKELKSRGYKRCSLAVQKDNYALRLYRAKGFATVRENEEEYIMVCDLYWT